MVSPGEKSSFSPVHGFIDGKSTLVPAITHSKDVAIQIDSIYSIVVEDFFSHDRHSL